VLVKADAFQRYVEYCEEGDYEVESQRAFTETILRSGALSTRPTIGCKQQHCYQGYKFKGTDPIFPDKENAKQTTQMKVIA